MGWGEIRSHSLRGNSLKPPPTLTFTVFSSQTHLNLFLTVPSMAWALCESLSRSIMSNLPSCQGCHTVTECAVEVKIGPAHVPHN